MTLFVGCFHLPNPFLQSTPPFSPPCLRIWQFLAAEFTAANLCPGGGVEPGQGREATPSTVTENWSFVDLVRAPMWFFGGAVKPSK